MTGALDMAIAGYKTVNTNFGGGLETPGGRRIKNAAYAEGFAAPRIGAEIALPGAGTLYGQAGWVLALTRGDGDPGGNSFYRPDNIDSEILAAGWRSGDALPGGPRDWLDISWGRQSFEIGDGFLVADGNNEQTGKAAILLGPRSAFESAALLRVNTRPVRADLFHLQSDHDFSNVNLYGLNVEWHDDRYGQLGLYGFKIYQAANDEDGLTRDGLLTLSARGDVHPLADAGLADLNLAFEAAWQTNDRPGPKVVALGWHVTLGYDFTDLPWQPRLAYRYSHFSGDDPNTGKSEAFDPLFVAGPGFGTWFQGEIVGQYLITNSNINVHSVHLTARPAENIAAGLIFFDNSLHRPATFEGGVASRDFAREIDLYAEIAVGDHVTLTPLAAVAWPGKGAEEAYGDDKAYGLIEGFVNVSF